MVSTAVTMQDANGNPLATVRHLDLVGSIVSRKRRSCETTTSVYYMTYERGQLKHASGTTIAAGPVEAPAGSGERK